MQLPTPSEVSGDFSANGPFGGGISEQFVADARNARTDGTTTCAQAIAAIPGSTPAASGVAWASVFPTNVIPTQCMDPVAQNLLQYLPAATLPGSVYQGVPTQADNQDQFTVRLDHKINNRQNLSVYYYFTDETVHAPFYNFQASGANVPGFGTSVKQRFQQWNPSHTWTISNALVNEFHVTYLREGQLTSQHPQNTGAVTSFCTGAAASYCFTGTSDSSVINSAIVNNGTPTSGPAMLDLHWLALESHGVAVRGCQRRL